MKKHSLYALLFFLSALVSACTHEGENATSLSVNTDKVNIPASPQTACTFTVSAAADWTISKNSEAQWLSIYPEKGVGVTTITLTATTNATTTSRSVKLKVVSAGSNKEITVTQQNATLILPENAGPISGNSTNNCPYTATVELSITPINGAAFYKWYCNGEVAATTTLATYAASRTGAYTVAGVNLVGEGTPSSEKRITITSCPLPEAAGSITGTNVNLCPAEHATLSIDPIINAVSYQWYKNGVAIANATAATYSATTSGSYTVAGVNGAGEGVHSPQKVVTITECQSLVDDYIGEWDVAFEVIVSGASANSFTQNYSQGTFTHTVTITKVDSRTVKIKGIQTTGKDEIFGSVDESLQLIIGGQKLNPSWDSNVDTYIAPMITTPPCSNMGQTFAPTSIQIISGQPTIELKSAASGHTVLYNGTTYTASYVILAVTPGTTNCLGYFCHAIGTKWVKKTSQP